MSSDSFFQDLNKFYKNTDQNSTDYLNITKNYKTQNSEKFLKNINNLFYKNSETYSQLNKNLITLNATVVDIFENEMGITRIKHKNGTYYSLFNNLASDDIYEIKEEDILETKLGDINVFLVLIDNEELCDLNFCGEFWKNLNSKFGEDIMQQKLIPLKVYSFDSKIKLGERIRISGFLSKNDFEEFRKNKNDLDYLDYYQSNLVYSMYALDFEKIEFAKDLEIVGDKFLLKKVEDMFFDIFGDEIAAKFMIFSLFSNCETKVSHESLNFFTFNFYNLKKEDIKKILNLLNSINSLYTYLDINNEKELKEEIFAKKNFNLGIMELNKIYTGSNDMLLIDETEVSVTKLTEKATKNIVRIKELIQFQKISLFFFGNQIFKFPYENSVIGFSHYRSMFNFNCKLCVKNKNKKEENSKIEEKLNNKENSQMEEEEKIQKKNSSQIIEEKMQIENDLNKEEILKINQIINYLKKKLNEIEFKKEDLEDIEQSFVKMRKNDSKFTQDDFKFIIKIAKHLAVSNFTDFVDKETFFKAIDIREEISKREKNFIKDMKNK